MPAVGARVQWRDAQGLQGTVELSFVGAGGEIFIGRAMECAIRTDDPMVSRRHARITFQDGRHVIEDLGSANGIYVGDARTQMHALTNGDSVRCGSLWLTYENDGFGAAPGMGMGAPGGGLGVGPQGTQMLVAPSGPPNLGGGAGPGGFGNATPMGGGAAGPPFAASPPMSPMAPMSPPRPPTGFGGGPPPSFGGGPPPSPGFGGGAPPSFGGGPPPPSFGAPAGATSFGGGMAPAGGPPPPAAPAPMGSTVDPQSEMMRMQRRIDQLTSEVRILRGGGDGATRMEELEEKLSRLERDNHDLNEKCNRLERLAAQGGGGSVAIGTAQLRLGRAEEVVNGLNDVLSELRINILAAEGEVEQWGTSLPRASFDLVRESLRGSRAHMETAKELMRMLRAEGR
jgi:hypothetical protein